MSGLPPLCHLDIGVIESLPPELLSELNEIYCGKLVDLIAGGKGEAKSFTSALQETAKGKILIFLAGYVCISAVCFLECLTDIWALFNKVQQLKRNLLHLLILSGCLWKLR